MVADRYNLNKTVDRETRKKYQIDVANRFSALEGLDISSVDDTWVKISFCKRGSRGLKKIGIYPGSMRNVQN